MIFVVSCGYCINAQYISKLLVYVFYMNGFISPSEAWKEEKAGKHKVLQEHEMFYEFHVLTHAHTHNYISTHDQKFSKVMQHRGDYAHYWSHRGQWMATQLLWQWSEIINVNVCNSLSSCVQVNRPTVIKTFFYPIKIHTKNESQV